jgi:hypothetical protein
MIDVGIPEAIAEMTPKRLACSPKATPIGLPRTCCPSLVGRRAPSSSSPRTTPRRSPKAKAVAAEAKPVDG